METPRERSMSPVLHRHPTTYDVSTDVLLAPDRLPASVSVDAVGAFLAPATGDFRDSIWVNATTGLPSSFGNAEAQSLLTFGTRSAAIDPRRHREPPCRGSQQKASFNQASHERDAQ